MAQFLKIKQSLTHDDYTVTNEEVKQAFLDHGPVQQYNLQETEKPQNDNCHLKRLELKTMKKITATDPNFQGTWVY